MKSNIKANACLDKNQIIIKDIVENYNQALRIMDKKSDDDDLAIMICNSMCNNLDINNLIVSVCSPIGTHHVLAVELDNKYYILDLTFQNYVKGSNYKITEKNRNDKFYGYPSFFMLKNKGRNLIEHLLTEAYFECTEENMKLYCDSFALSKYNQNRKLKDLVYTTNITGNEYLLNMIIRKMDNQNDYCKIR